MTPELDRAIEACLQELAAPYGADPYWPKWDTHWWRLALLLELGALDRVPPELAENFAARLDSHYLHHFPLRESELPPDCNPYGQILCHCALGTAAQILLGCGIQVWERLPWLYSWLFRYQLDDGGYNCDEQAYTGSGKSSLVSTVPVLEALLASRPDGPLDERERTSLQAGLDYLLDHRLFQRRSGEVINQAWLRPLFPRFYEYDILRGFRLALNLSERLQVPLPWSALTEAYELLNRNRQPQAWYLLDEQTLVPAPGDWQREPIRRFDLLELARGPHVSGACITAEWAGVQTRLTSLRARGLIQEQNHV